MKIVVTFEQISPRNARPGSVNPFLTVGPPRKIFSGVLFRRQMGKVPQNPCLSHPPMRDVKYFARTRILFIIFERKYAS